MRFSRPFRGLLRLNDPDPSDESLGYFHPSAPRTCLSCESDLPREATIMNRVRILLSIAALLLVSVSAAAQTADSIASENTRIAGLQELVNRAAHAALEKFADRKLT